MSSPQASPAIEKLVGDALGTRHETLVILDADLRVRLASRAFYLGFQLTPAATVGRPLSEILGDEWAIPDRRTSFEEMLTQSDDSEPFEIEYVFPRLGHRLMLVHMQRLVGADAADALILVALQDMTEEGRADDEWRDHVTVVGHELRNAVTAILGYAEAMELGILGQERAIATIVHQAREMTRLIGELLPPDGMSIGAVAAPVRVIPACIDLVALAEDAVQQAQLLSVQHHIRLQRPDGPLEGMWDAGLLGRVFANLLSNAVKYSTPQSEILVTVEDLGTMARVSVQDRGLGIRPAELEHVFDPFYRGAAVTSRVPGLGLGLHVARTLVEAHGGSISAVSTLGIGSIFSFSLPLLPLAHTLPGPTRAAC